MRGGVRRAGLLGRFRPGTWYEASIDAMEPDVVVLHEGGRHVRLRAAEVEIRGAADDAWEIRDSTRTMQVIDGQTLDHPTRIAECPLGHRRHIPTRFDARVAALRCAQCGTSYRIDSPESSR